MPNCTVRYHVRLVPKAPDAMAVDAIGIFTEDRSPNEHGEPGSLVSRHLTSFSGPAGSSIREMVTHGDAWHLDVQDRVGPLEWDGGDVQQSAYTRRPLKLKQSKQRRKWLF